jgi:hypothetical protein
VQRWLRLRPLRRRLGTSTFTTGGAVRFPPSPGDAAGRTVKIVSVGHGGGRLVLHGEEVEMAGTAWNVVVDQKSGDLTGAVLTRVGG